MKRSTRLLRESADAILRAALAATLAAGAFIAAEVAIAHDKPGVSIAAVMAGLALVIWAVLEACEFRRLDRLAELERAEEARRSIRPRL